MADPGESLADQIVNLLGPSEAEAAPFGRIGKDFVKRLTKGEVSSASKDLVGKEVFGKIVTGVVKGKGDWRYIQFSDKTERAVTKDVINELMQEAGTVAKMTELAGKTETTSRLEQAARSLKFHQARQNLFATKKAKEDWLKIRNQHVTQMGMQPTPYVWVESERLFMPEEYARILEDAGRIKIKKKK